jgi:uncharacterized protein (TIGR02757 family)
MSESLKSVLDGLYIDCMRHLSPDPRDIVQTFTQRDDQEIAAFITAFLSLGRVDSIKKNLAWIFEKMAPSPAGFLRRVPSADHAALFNQFKYRFYTAGDLILLFLWLQTVLKSFGSLEKFFMVGFEPNDHIGPALSSFVQRMLALPKGEFACPLVRGGGIRHFLADPADGSACKRLNLFLRWMVRNDCGDFGLWHSIPARMLVIPLDTHITRLSRAIGLTGRCSPGWNMAVEITESLRKLDPDDPVKYDFALCHTGMHHPCPGQSGFVSCSECPLKTVCQNVKKSPDSEK